LDFQRMFLDENGSRSRQRSSRPAASVFGRQGEAARRARDWARAALLALALCTDQAENWLANHSPESPSTNAARIPFHHLHREKNIVLGSACRTFAIVTNEQRHAKTRVRYFQTSILGTSIATRPSPVSFCTSQQTTACSARHPTHHTTLNERYVSLFSPCAYV
jgi:hypothetical protein